MPEKKTRKPRVAKKPNIYLKVIYNLVDIPKECPPSFWAKESKLAKELCNKYGEEKVLAYTPISKHPSLAYFIAVGDVEKKIERNWRLKNIVIPKRTTYVLGEKIGEDVGLSPPIDTIRSWLSEKKPPRKKNSD